MNYKLNKDTLTLDRIDQIPDGYRAAETSKNHDYIEETVDTIFMRSLQTIMKDCFNINGHYLFGNRAEFWNTPDFFIFGEPDKIFMFETKRGKPSPKDIDKFLDDCDRLEKLLYTDEWPNKIENPDSYKSLIEHDHKDLQTYETIYFCSFFFRIRAFFGLKGHFKIPLGHRLRKNENLVEWKDFLLDKRVEELKIDKRVDERKTDKTTLENESHLSITPVDALPKNLNAFQARAIWLVPAFNKEMYQERLSSRDHKSKTAEDAYILKYQLYIKTFPDIKTSPDFAISLDNPIKWQSYKT